MPKAHSKILDADGPWTFDIPLNSGDTYTVSLGNLSFQKAISIQKLSEHLKIMLLALKLFLSV